MLNRDEIFNLKSKADVNKSAIHSDIINDDIKHYNSMGNHSYKSSYQPGSVDLHVGDIFQPNKKDKESNKVKKRLNIKPGETILVKTLEEIDLPLNIGGICFAPARLSLKGILIVNIGHIDPGYSGKLHFTIVNLGKDSFTIEKGNMLATMLLFEYNKIEDYMGMSEQQSVDDILPQLSKSFMNFEKTIDIKIRNAAFIKPVLITVFGFVVTVSLSLIISQTFQHFSYKNQVDQNHQLIKEQQVEINSLKKELKKLEKKLAGLESTIDSNAQ